MGHTIREKTFLFLSGSDIYRYNNGYKQWKKPLLHIAGRDPYGDTFKILRAYLPNERTWIFRWMFNYILPKMFGNEIWKKAQAVITDGDYQFLWNFFL